MNLRLNRFNAIRYVASNKSSARNGTACWAMACLIEIETESLETPPMNIHAQKPSTHMVVKCLLPGTYPTAAIPEVTGTMSGMALDTFPQIFTSPLVFSALLELPGSTCGQKKKENIVLS
ncbi:hypothetical protein NDU88_010813 [Pleurodeles waltl]|uniref:Uncharacterized protein n=1 Tax=Pleurodeles waltl TaxID=8319 RepID=A0AAV7R1M0_PLEWA|nr:hypothetical protein NDU88_010813 [Pleurodeles waltl]